MHLSFSLREHFNVLFSLLFWLVLLQCGHPCCVIYFNRHLEKHNSFYHRTKPEVFNYCFVLLIFFFICFYVFLVRAWIWVEWKNKSTLSCTVFVVCVCHLPSQVSVTLSGPLLNPAAEQQCSEVVKGKYSLTHIKFSFNKNSPFKALVVYNSNCTTN